LKKNNLNESTAENSLRKKYFEQIDNKLKILQNVILIDGIPDLGKKMIIFIKSLIETNLRLVPR